eukprot:scaffold101248_cov63-Attheya_sp.AAC.1
MAAPASGHWTFGIIVVYGMGLGVGLCVLIIVFTGLRTVYSKTLAPTTTPVLPITITVPMDFALTAPVTTALEAAISANSVGGGVEEGRGGAIVIDVVAQSSISSAVLTVLSM